MIRSSFTKQTFAVLTMLISAGVGLPNPYVFSISGGLLRKNTRQCPDVLSVQQANQLLGHL